MQDFNKQYWENLYKNDKLGWDIGYISTPIKEYIDQLTDKSLKILIPGAGNGYEAEYLYKKGFRNTCYLDYSETAIQNFKKICPNFPESNIVKKDFFEHKGNYDLIIELTFFTSIIPKKRDILAKKIFDLLKTGGKYTGVFFSHEFDCDHPPYGAVKETYIEFIKGLFTIKTFETSYNSIKPRAGRELFFIFQKTKQCLSQ